MAMAWKFENRNLLNCKNYKLYTVQPAKLHGPVNGSFALEDWSGVYGKSAIGKDKKGKLICRAAAVQGN
jgi:hypothetical protein